MSDEDTYILEVKNLSVEFPVHKNVFLRSHENLSAVEEISFYIREGETLGLVGESGCGKTTLARAIIKGLSFHNPDVKITGNIFFRTDDVTVDIMKLNNREMRNYRSKIQIIFQDPYSSLNSRMSVRQIVEEPLLNHTSLNKEQRIERVVYILEKTGIQADYLNRYPHEFSGGQRQRIGIARALAANPALIIADEPVSALDVSVQAQVINLLQDLQKEFNLSILFISHDLSVVRHVSERIAVMYLGKMIETGQSDEVYNQPSHPYTKALLSSIPEPDKSKDRSKRIILKGEVPGAINKPGGCVFHTRCPVSQKDCNIITPLLVEKSKGHYSACPYY